MDEKVRTDDENKMHNVKANFQFLACARKYQSIELLSVCCGIIELSVFVFLMPVISLANFLSSSMCENSTDGVCNYLAAVGQYPDPIAGFLSIMGPDNHFYAVLITIAVLGAAVAMLKFSFATRPTLSRRDKRKFQAQAKYVKENVLPKKEQLYKEYLTDSVGEH